jgi:1-acyl-sn-glycerol-3-phosphate acyltransferase
MTDAVQAVRERTNILFFAEGTRSPDGTLAPFKKGAAILALQAGVPIVPMAVAGTKDIMRKGAALIRGGCSTALCIGEPISVEGLAIDDREALTAKARAAVEQLYGRALSLT